MDEESEIEVLLASTEEDTTVADNSGHAIDQQQANTHPEQACPPQLPPVLSLRQPLVVERSSNDDKHA